MKWAINIGRYLGIDVYLHVTFLLLLGFIATVEGMNGGWTAAIQGAVFLLAIFLCVLLHEFGHALMARRYGIKTRDITLLPIGGLARLERIPDQPAQELWVALAGPAVNVIIALGLAIGLLANGAWHPTVAFRLADGPFAERLLSFNVLLVLFNLLPAFPMDGGRVLRALLAMRMNYARATRLAATTGKAMALLFAVAGLFFNPLLVLIAFFVWMGASQEVGMAEMKHSLAGVSARAVMMTDFRWLSSEDSLAHAAEMLIAGWQQDFPVVDQGHVAGVLTRQDLIKGLAKFGPQGRIGAAMRREVVTIREDELLDAAVFRDGIPGATLVSVMRGGQLVGLVTLENLAEFLMIQKALGDRQQPLEPRVMPPPLPVTAPPPVTRTPL